MSPENKYAESLDAALRSPPLWTPPPEFARRVVERALRERQERIRAGSTFDVSAESLYLWSLAVASVAAFATWTAWVLPAQELASLWTLIAVGVGLALSIRTVVDRLLALSVPRG